MNIRGEEENWSVRSVALVVAEERRRAREEEREEVETSETRRGEEKKKMKRRERVERGPLEAAKLRMKVLFLSMCLVHSSCTRFFLLLLFSHHCIVYLSSYFGLVLRAV